MVAENLRKMIDKAGVSQAEISRRSGIPTSRISEILTGKIKNPGIDTIFRIASAVNGNIDFIASGEGDMFGRGEGQAAQALDKDLLRLVIEAVEQALDELKLKLKPDKKAELFITVYEMYQEDKPVDRKTLIRLVKLAA